jgi:hypothetical protein
MNKLFNTPLLLLLVLSMGILAACDKEDNVKTNKIELLSFGPTGAKHGDTLRFIGNNLDKVTEIDLTGAKVLQSAFLKQTSELILITVPKETQQGFVLLKTPEGDIMSKTKLNLNVTTKVSGITPQARPGSNITITGDYLNWATRVTFNNNKFVDSVAFVSKSMNQVVVTVPADAQTGRLVVSYGGTAPGPLEVITDTLKVTLPVITALSPNPIKHQTDLTITGTDLDLTSSVTFTGVTTPVTTFVSKTATQLVVKVPGGTQKGKVTLTAASGVKTVSTADLDVILPAVTSMSPNPVAVGSNLTVTGTNLDLVKSISFVGATEVTSFVSQTPTQIVVTVPANSAPGKITLFVLNSTLSVKSGTDLGIVGFAVAPIIIYDDALTSAWNGWTGGGWGGTKDVSNTSPVKSGTKSVRISYVGDWGVPWQLGGATISLAGYTSLKVSIYGGTGSNNQNVNIGFNEADGKTVTIVEGQWTDFTIPLTQISAATTLTHLYIKKYSTNGDFAIYVDNLGIY